MNMSTSTGQIFIQRVGYGRSYYPYSTRPIDISKINNVSRKN